MTSTTDRISVIDPVWARLGTIDVLKKLSIQHKVKIRMKNASKGVSLWKAKKLGIPLRFPPEHPFNPLPLLRLAIACDCAPDAVHRIFRFVWRDGRLPDLPIEWTELEHELGVVDAGSRIASADVKDALRRNTDEAIARGVFGVPTLAIGDALFWGADATQMAVDFVAAGCRYDDPVYERVATLPVGASRARSSAAGRNAPVRKP